MRKIETVCPFCAKAKTIETAGTAANVSLKCSQCSKVWDEDLSEAGSLAKSAHAPSSELDRLRVQVRGQFSELMTKINALAANRAAAAARPTRFNINGREVEKSDEVNREFLNKALENGTRIDVARPAESSSPKFQTVESVGSGQRVRAGQPFDTNGIEKSDVAAQELEKALNNGKPVGFTPRGN